MWVSVAIGFLHNHIFTLNRLVHYLNPAVHFVFLQRGRKTLKLLCSHLAEESWIQASEFVGHILFVHVVELVEGGSGWEAALHQVQHRHHA